MGTKIKDAQLLESVTGAERIPVSDGSGNPKAVTTEALKNFVGAGSSGDGGIPIVDSEEKLETLDLPQGSLASVAYNTLSVVSFRDMYQPTAADIDQESGGSANPDALSSVPKLEFTVPAVIQSGEPDTGFVLVPRTFSAANQSMIALYFIVNTDGNVQGLAGYIVTSESYEEVSFFSYDDNGVPSIDQTSIDKLNALLETDDWCYFGLPEVGFTLTEAQFDTIDKFVKAVSGISNTDLYIKGSKGWKKENPLKVSELENDKKFISEANILLKYEFKELSGYNTVLTIKPNTITEFEYIDSSDEVVDIYLHHTDEYSEYILICNGYVSFYNSIIWKDSKPPKSKNKIIIKLVYKGEGESFFAEWLETSSVTMEFECESTTDSFNVLNPDYGNGVRNYFPVELLIVDGKEKGGFFIMSEAGKHDVVCVLPDIYEEIAKEKNITSLVIKNARTIEQSAFFRCSKLKSVTITGELTHIGDYAFYGCTSLSSITLPSSLTHIGDNAFYNTSLTSINIPSKVISIGIDAFYGTNISVVNAYSLDSWMNIDFKNRNSNPMGSDCSLYVSSSMISSLTINGDVKNYTFAGCKSLTSVLIGKNAKSIGAGSFMESGVQAIRLPTGSYAHLPEDFYSIGDFAFYNCRQLEKVEFPPLLKKVGEKAFCSLPLIKELLFPNSIVEFGNANGSDCQELTVIAFPECAESISLHNCQSLKTVVMPNNCSAIKSLGNTNLDDLFLSEKISYIYYGVMGSSAKVKRVHIKNISNICKIRYGVSGYGTQGLGSIGESYYYNGQPITKVVLPNDTAYIETLSISGISSMIELYTGDSCVKINHSSLPSSLVKIVFGKCIQNIDSSFGEKVELLDFRESLYIPKTRVQSKIQTSCQIVVPDNLYDEWIVAENWSDLASQIVKASEYVEPTNE